MEPRLFVAFIVTNKCRCTLGRLYITYITFYRYNYTNMKNNKNHILMISINGLVFVFSMIGVLATSIGTPLFMASTTILYYTIQSNLWIGFTCLATAILGFIQIRNKSLRIPSWLYVVKYVFTVAITLTMIVFWLLIAPTLHMPSYLLSLSNLFSHTLTPILALVSFFVFDSRDNFLSKKSSVFSLATPIYYFVFFLLVSSTGVMFGLYRSPYFFLDFYEFGWFGFNVYSEAYGFASFGIFYWIILILLLIFLLGFGLMSLNRLFFKKTIQIERL